MRSPLRLFAAMRLTAGMDVASEPNPRRRVRICRRLAVDSFLYGPRCRRARARGVGDESCATSVVTANGYAARAGLSTRANGYAPPTRCSRQWASRHWNSAPRELLATGETGRKRTVQAPDQLTAQEAHIARLARDGLSNPDIGARLFISPRTVEYHLRTVFTKVGISSRKQLREALADGSRAALRR
jgi:DNA-binding CsgD family transcriptional regulator